MSLYINLIAAKKGNNPIEIELQTEMLEVEIRMASPQSISGTL